MDALMKEAINAYFDDIKSLLKKMSELKRAAELEESQYKRIVIPALYALIERLAYSRYGSLLSGERFKRLLNDYSGQKEELDKVDIVFLYQWDNSEQAKKKVYKTAIQKVHPQVKTALIEILGEEKNIHIHMGEGERFRKRNDIYQQILTKVDVSGSLAESSLDLFDRCSVIYLYGRCSTIHEGDFSSRGFIDIEYLFQLLCKITVNLEAECQSKQAFPWLYPT